MCVDRAEDVTGRRVCVSRRRLSVPLDRDPAAGLPCQPPALEGLGDAAVLELLLAGSGQPGILFGGEWRRVRRCSTTRG